MTTDTKLLPTDPAEPRLTPDDCFVWGEESEYAIQCNRHRATATRLFAQEYGIDFQSVKCRRDWIAFHTRQEAWEAQCEPEEHLVSEWADNHDPMLQWSDGEWRLPDGTAVPVPEWTPEQLVVPDDWSPNEGTPVWTFCPKDHPDAIPIWRLEER